MLSKFITTQFEYCLEKLLENCNVIDASVVSTLDGHLCAMRQRILNRYPLERLATMGSTLISLGDTITTELKMGHCDNIISENKNGIVAFMHIREEYVLVTVTTQKNALGMLLSYSRRCTEEMAKILV
jgi:predicted regulator of Ras-like GTPase activity (Roadblock/LC7/MglB family)